MPKNEILDDYLDSTFDINFNSDIIHNKLNRIANKKKVLINMLATLIIITAIGTFTNFIYAKRQWDKEYEEYKNRKILSGQVAFDDNLFEKIDMDYIYYDGIGVKIDSILLTNDLCQMDINFKVTDDFKGDLNIFDFGIAIYDEEKNVYMVSNRGKYSGKGYDYTRKLCKELGIEYNTRKNLPYRFSQSHSTNQITFENNLYNFRFKTQTCVGFPKSKKLFVRIFDIGYSLESGYSEENGHHIVTEAEDFPLSNSEWQFEIEIPEEFYMSRVKELEFSEQIDGFELEKAELSRTGLIIIINHKYPLIKPSPTQKIEITDSEGNRYFRNVHSTDNRIEILYYDNEFNHISDTLYLEISIPEYNINKKVELIEKCRDKIR